MFVKENCTCILTISVQITFDNYKTRHPVYEAEEEEDSDEYEEQPEKSNWGRWNCQLNLPHVNVVKLSLAQSVLSLF